MALQSAATKVIRMASVAERPVVTTELAADHPAMVTRSYEVKDADIKHLKDAIWTHKVVVVKGQKDLDPKKHWELVTRFDPAAPQVHSHGDIKTFKQKGGMLSRRRAVVGIPGAGNVRLIGKGYQGEDHYGIKDLTVRGLSHDFHAKDLPEEDFEAGNTRFQRWQCTRPILELVSAL